MTKEEGLDKLVDVFDSREIDDIHDRNLDLRYNQIYLVGAEGATSYGEGLDDPGIDSEMANRFMKNMNLVRRINPGKPILIHMSTCGGDWRFGMQIYDIIQAARSQSHVTIINYSYARSTSSVIFQAADRRVMMPHSYFMFHLGGYEDDGELRTAKSNMDFYVSETDTMVDIYVERMRRVGSMKKLGERRIRRWIHQQMEKKGNVFLTAEETVRKGLADEIFQGWEYYINEQSQMPRA